MPHLLKLARFMIQVSYFRGNLIDSEAYDKEESIKSHKALESAPVLFKDLGNQVGQKLHGLADFFSRKKDTLRLSMFSLSP